MFLLVLTMVIYLIAIKITINSNIYDNDSNNIDSDNNRNNDNNKNKKNNKKTTVFLQYKSDNTNSKVKHKIKPKDHFD